VNNHASFAGLLPRTILVLTGVLALPVAWGQVKKQFSVEPVEKCEQIKLDLRAKSGNCFIRPSQNREILMVYSNQDLEEYGHSFSNEVSGNVCRVQLSLDQEGREGLSRQITSQMFGHENRSPEKIWKIYLSELKPYDLELAYGVGRADVDLSGLSVNKLKINTGSADVRVGFSTGMANRVAMDTFFVKVDVGSVDVRQVNLCRSKVMVADVGFGNLELDFSQGPVVANRVFGSVGAGNLDITLPGADVAVMVRIKDSWLCSVRLSKTLQPVGENMYANEAYTKNGKDALIFDLDVSLGNIRFR
jgi:hypothetical protein